MAKRSVVNILLVVSATVGYECRVCMLDHVPMLLNESLRNRFLCTSTHPVTGDQYFPYQETHWAWRYAPHPRFRLNYSTFTVTYNAQDILRNRTNILEELYSMPSREPERFRSLRLGVSRAAKRMHYGLTDCKRENCDAFKIFKDIVIARARQLNEMT